MPINAYHSLANGLIFRKPNLIEKIVGILISKISIAKEFVVGRALVWRQFERNAKIADNCLLGPSAWCVNMGEKDNIILAERVACRGVIRCENWNSAKLIIDNDVYIGDDCLISCADRIEIGSYTLLAHGVQIFDNDSHPIDSLQRQKDYQVARGQLRGKRGKIDTAPVIIGSRVWLGFNAIILKGVTIGQGSIVAAGSVVVENIPANTVVAGNPARIVKTLYQGA